MKFKFDNDLEFESFVRKIASEIWQARGYTGPITVDGRERDGILESENNIYCIEITVSKAAKHTKDACRKLESLIQKLRKQHPDKGVTGWYITRHEATGEQGSILKSFSHVIVHKTYDQFYGTMIDAKQYLMERPKKPFGSVRNPENDRFDTEVKYTPTKILETRSGKVEHSSTIFRSISRAPLRALLIGEYGAGKSMTLRDIYQRLSRNYMDGSDSQFPVYINLRDHIEQFDPDECLRRHAVSVGINTPEKLIRAWRSGLTYLLLDGFDELAPRIVTSSKIRAQNLRNSAVSLVKRFVDETPMEGSIIIAGRDNYFDNDEELCEAIGARKGWSIYKIHDLDDDDLDRFIRDQGWSGGLPSWLPKKPLLIAYIKKDDLFNNGDDDNIRWDRDPVQGWDYLIDKICVREVEQVYLALEPSELRSIYGRLSTMCRRKDNRRGPLTFSDSSQAFIDVTGVEPEERSITAILRLPGLSGAVPSAPDSEIERGSRYFVDTDFADALSAEDLYHAVRSPYHYKYKTHEKIIHPIGYLACGIFMHKMQFKVGEQIGEALRVFSSGYEEYYQNLCIDLIKLATENRERIPQNIFLHDIYMETLDIEDHVDISNVKFVSCAFEVININIDDLNGFPNFEGCQIGQINVNPSVFDEIIKVISVCNEIDEKVLNDFTYDDLRQFEIPDQFMDLLSILDKLFVQSLSGRLESAMYRGRPPERRRSIDSILRNMEREGWISYSKRAGERIIVPERTKALEARRIISGRETSHRFAE
ncbi:NACHT domain-containing protein [Tistrella mobilis]